MTPKQCKSGMAVEVRYSGDKWVLATIQFPAGWGKAGRMFAVQLDGGKLDFAYPSEMRPAGALERLAREV